MVLQRALRTCPSGSVCSQTHASAGGCCQSPGADVSINDCSASLVGEDARDQARKYSENVYQNPCFATFSQSTGASVPNLYPESLSEYVEGVTVASGFDACRTDDG